MIEIEIKVSRNLGKTIEKAAKKVALKQVKTHYREKVGSVRNPATGEFPTVAVQGNDLESNLQIQAEGSPETLALVRKRLGSKKEGNMATPQPAEIPCAFLSHASEDAELAEHIAKELQSNKIDTWWDRWCITSGDSIRQKIDEGIENCTHFLVLLTPKSISKPWVKAEMDAGFFNKLEGKCKFVPLRYNLEVNALPSLLRGMLSPEIGADRDISQLISDIHGLSRKPSLGPTPHAEVARASTVTGFSPAANAIARYFVKNTKLALHGDPIIELKKLAEATGLTLDDTEDAFFELSCFFNTAQMRDSAFPVPALFVEFDRHWMPWIPGDDALKLVTEIMNNADFPTKSRLIAQHFGWGARRFNSMIAYMIDRDLVHDTRCIGVRDFSPTNILIKRAQIRRFVRSRQ